MTTRQLLNRYALQATSLTIDADAREYALDQVARLYHELAA